MQATEDSKSSVAFARRTPSNSFRQPIEKRYREAAPTFGPNEIEFRPECAIILARCVVTWSYIEVQLALLLATLMNTNEEKGLALFLSVRSSRTQYDMLNSVAEVSLSSSDYELFGALMNARASIEKERNDLVHGLFGTSVLVRDGLIWTDQFSSTSHTTKIWAADFIEQYDESMNKKIFVYEIDDMEAIASRLGWLHDQIGFFRGYISSEISPWRDKRYGQLCAEPQMAQALTRMREKHKKSP